MPTTMPDTPTPGQVCYEAYWQVHRHDGHFHAPPPFAMLPEITRASWEAAAQAVLTQALADRVWDRQAPSSRWQETPRPREEDPRD